MTYSPIRHDLPSVLVQADRPLSADVTGRSVEALEYLWQVTTNTADSTGGALSSPQGHTHDLINDQTLTADSAVFAGWPFGFGSPRLQSESPLSPAPATPHLDPNGGWAAGAATGALVPIRGQVFVPYDAPTSAAFSAAVLIEKGAVLSAANAVTISVTVGGIMLAATSGVAAVGLEVVTVGPWPAGILPAAGTNELIVSIATALSSDYARVWHASVFP